MEPWKRVWRLGLAPLLPEPGLTALKDALQADDDRILQGTTTDLPALAGLLQEPIQAACAVAFCGWQSLGLRTQGEVLTFYDQLCTLAEVRLNEVGVCNHFFNWYDQTPRPAMRAGLLAEVRRELRRRHKVAA